MLIYIYNASIVVRIHMKLPMFHTGLRKDHSSLRFIFQKIMLQQKAIIFKKYKPPGVSLFLGEVYTLIYFCVFYIGNFNSLN